MTERGCGGDPGIITESHTALPKGTKRCGKQGGTKEFIVNVLASTMGTIVIEEELENYAFKAVLFPPPVMASTTVYVLRTSQDGRVHTTSRLCLHRTFKAVNRELQFQLFSVFINSVMICRILSSEWEKNNMIKFIPG